MKIHNEEVRALCTVSIKLPKINKYACAFLNLWLLALCTEKIRMK